MRTTFSFAASAATSFASFASALATQGIPLFEIGAVLGHRQLSTTTRYAHHAPERLVATAAVAARAWDREDETEAA